MNEQNPDIMPLIIALFAWVDLCFIFKKSMSYRMKLINDLDMQMAVNDKKRENA